MKYNPGFLSEEKLRESFIVRQSDLASIVRIIRENTGGANQHVLVVGSRGMGKTTLVHRVAAEVRSDGELAARWYPVLYAEESYLADTPGRFWLEAVLHIARQTGETRWRATYEDLKRERDEPRLRERALAAILDFADQQGRKLLLVVENLNMLLEDMIKPADAWALRHTLQNEPRLMLLATATSATSGVKDADKALFDLFKVHQLQPLTDEECAKFWDASVSTELPVARARQIQILTGGNPRLLAVIAAFGRQLSFRNLMEELLHLVDDHTDYFKSHLEGIPATERKVYLALAEIWSPATAAEIDEHLHMGVSQVGSLLSRLESRGAIGVPAGRPTRPKRYQVSERLYNIYWLLRRHGEAAERVRGLITVMEAFYPRGKIVDLVGAVAAEACKLGDVDRRDHLTAYEEFVRRATDEGTRTKMLIGTPEEFWKLSGLPPTIRKLHSEALTAKTERDRARLEKKLLRALEKDPNDAITWLNLGFQCYESNGRYEEAINAYRRVTRLNPRLDVAWLAWGNIALVRLKDARQALDAFRGGLAVAPDNEMLWFALSQAAFLDRQFLVALDAAKKTVEISPKMVLAWILLSHAYKGVGADVAEIETPLRRATEIDPHLALAWASLAEVVGKDSLRKVEAESFYRKAIELDNRSVSTKAEFGEFLLEDSGRVSEAMQLFRDALTGNRDSQTAIRGLIRACFRTAGSEDEAIKLAERWFEENPKDVEFRAQCVLEIVISLKREYFPWALKMAKKVLELSPRFENNISVCGLLIMMGRGVDALPFFRAALQYAESIDNFVERCSNFPLLLFRAGADPVEILGVLVESPRPLKLEVLIAGFRLFLKEEVQVPAEVLSVAQDLARTLERLRPQPPAIPAR